MHRALPPERGQADAGAAQRATVLGCGSAPVAPLQPRLAQGSGPAYSTLLSREKGPGCPQGCPQTPGAPPKR